MLVFSTKVMRFDTLIEAELEKAMDRGERAYLQTDVTEIRENVREILRKVSNGHDHGD